jgi:hypothetical protein
MDFFAKFNLSPVRTLKALGLLVVGIFVVALAFELVGSSVGSLFENVRMNSFSVMPSYPGSSSQGYGKSSDDLYREEDAAGLSLRNILGVPAPSVPGADAEAFEVTDYQGTIETRNLADTCDAIYGLKGSSEVIFESATQYDRGCAYTFKAAHVRVPEVLSLIESLDPKELSENTYTIKRLVDDYTSEIDIIEKKLASIDATLENAIEAYDAITLVATRAQSAESLAKIIDSKVAIIERLTRERIAANAELERLDRAKAEQLDRLEYTYFRINVYENKFVDFQDLKDSWTAAVKEFVRDINAALQDMTITLVLLLVLLLQYALYFFVLLLVAKYGWLLVKHIWRA